MCDNMFSGNLCVGIFIIFFCIFLLWFFFFFLLFLWLLVTSKLLKWLIDLFLCIQYFLVRYHLIFVVVVFVVDFYVGQIKRVLMSTQLFGYSTLLSYQVEKASFSFFFSFVYLFVCLSVCLLAIFQYFSTLFSVDFSFHVSFTFITMKCFSSFSFSSYKIE